MLRQLENYILNSKSKFIFFEKRVQINLSCQQKVQKKYQFIHLVLNVLVVNT